MQIVGEIETSRRVDILQSIPLGRFHKIVNAGRPVGTGRPIDRKLTNNADTSFG